MMLPVFLMAALAAAAPADPIGAGLDHFKHHRFKAAAAEFQRAVEADARSAAAHFYLGYALYKIAEPTRRLTPDKQRAAAEFAQCFELDPQFRPVWARR
jgi:tetratricopeptide (TPR) repeat protein